MRQALRMSKHLFALLLLSGCVDQVTRDQRDVRRLCGLPDDTTVTSWTGLPSSAGFGQREGLSVSGVFNPPATWSPSAAGLRALPWPTAREAVERDFRLGAELDTGRFARCQTAGNDVLHATGATPCDAVPRLLDVILCVVTPSRQVRATVRSAY